jgi:glycerol kinase
MAFQTQELLAAMEDDAGVRLSQLKVDGGASINDQLMQTQADLLDVTVRRPVVAETTALGAAYLAGLAVGYWDSTEDVARNWALDREFTPAMSAAERDQRCRRWKRAVERTLGWESD